MPPTVDAIDLLSDAGEMSLYGLELQSIAARLVQHQTRAGISAELHLSVMGTLNPHLPTEKYPKGEFALVLDLIKHPTFVAPAHAVIKQIYNHGRRRRIEIAQKVHLGYCSAILKPESVVLEIRCVDTAVGDDEYLRPLGKRLAKVPLEVVDTGRACGCELKIRKSHAGIVLYDPTDPEWAEASYYLCGEFVPCLDTSDRRRHPPFNSLVGTLYDGDFQLLRNVHDLQFSREPGRRRTLRWAVADSTSLPLMAGKPDRMTVRWETDDT
jgi:hypothetical protein